MADFLEIDVEGSDSERLVEYLHELGANPEHSRLAESIRKELVRRALKERGLSPAQTVKTLVRNTDKRVWPSIADEWADSLGLTRDEFLRMAQGKATR